MLHEQVIGFRFQVSQHILRHAGKIIFRFPAPVFSRHTVINALRPAVGNRLPVIGFIRNGKFRNMFFNFCGNLLQAKNLWLKYYTRCGY